MLRLSFLFVGMAFFLFFPPKIQSADTFYLCLANQRLKQVVIEFEVKPGDLFFYHYIHSSDHTPIKDTFRVEKDGKMTLIEEAYLWYGAGLEFQDHSPIKIDFQGTWTRVQLNRILAYLPLRIGRIAQQEIIINDRRYALTKFGKGGDCLHFYLTPKEKYVPEARTHIPER